MRIWYGEADAGARFIVENTSLRSDSRLRTQAGFCRIFPNDSRHFVRNPDFVKSILYLDRPDIIITHGDPEVPIMGIEFCAEAPTGHNMFQRLGRVAAAAGFSIPFAFVFPEKKWIRRRTGGRWDEYNPLIFKTLLQIGHFHNAPVLGFFFPWSQAAPERHGKLVVDRRYRDLPSRRTDEMRELFEFVEVCLDFARQNRALSRIVFEEVYTRRQSRMWQQYSRRCRDVADEAHWVPLSSCEVIETGRLRDYLRTATGLQGIRLNQTILSRPRSVVYTNESRDFRADPYAGATIGVDYLRCRKGPTFSDRHTNLVVFFQNASVSQIVEKYQNFYDHRCPFRQGYRSASRSAGGIPYLNLHLKEGCKYTKQKEIRQICSFADVLVFRDGVIY